MKKIYFVRHGQTDYNLKKIAQGRLDIPLNATGISQAEQMSENLKNTKIDIIYSSPLSRAYKTAEIINKHHNVKLVADERLSELDIGTMAGNISIDDWKNFGRIEILDNFRKYNAESMQELYNRVVNFYQEIENSQYENILIVSHSGVYHKVYRYLHNLMDFRVKAPTPKNCEIVVLKNEK